MARDYSQPHDPYGIAKYTAQSADQDIVEVKLRSVETNHDVRGNSVCKPRSIPTQEEADHIMGCR